MDLKFALFNPIFNCVSDGSFLFVGVCLGYYLIKKGDFKTNLLKWIIAANNLFLIFYIAYAVWYIIELYLSWMSGVEYEQYAIMNRFTGPYWFTYWYMIVNSILLPNLLWFKRIRHSAWILPFLFIPAFFELYVIIVISLNRDYLPSSWTMYHPFTIDIINLVIYIGLLIGMYYLIAWRNAKRVMA